MFTDELNTFVKEQYARLKKYYGCEDLKTITLSSTVKLAEEVGELCTEVLTFNNLSRKNHDKDKMADEFADVLITTLILGHAMNVDIDKALQKKIAIVTKRFSSK